MQPVARHLVVGLATAALACVLGLLPFGELAELKIHDLLQSASAPGRASEHIVIVAIDEPSFGELGTQWPWPRSTHAQLVRKLSAAGARVIGFDIAFAEPSNTADDEDFARAIGEAGKVVLASFIEFIDDPRVTGTMLVEPIDSLAAVASAGFVTIPLDRDFVVRRYLERDDADQTFAEAVAEAFAGRQLEFPGGAYLAYLGPPGTYPTASYYQALEPEEFLPPGFFAGKIALVGRSINTSPAPGHSAPDVFATPFLFGRESSLMSGVEVQANMVDGLLNGRFVKRAPFSATLVLTLVLGLAGSALQWKWSPLRSGALALVFLVACGTTGYFLFAARGLWIPTLPGIVAAVVPFVWLGAISYLESEKKRGSLRRVFSHYLSPSILEDVLKNPESISLGGKRTEVTVLFSDLAGFSTLSEKLQPEETGRFLNRYFTEMTKVVFAHGGTVDKFVGDALIAFWGAPVPDSSHALNACRAAVAMQARLETLRGQMRAEGLPEPWARIGLNTGDAVVGNMGSAELFNYTVLGDAVNLAARLEAANKEFGTRILVSEFAVRRAGDGALNTRSLGSIKTRGRSAEVEVFELLGIAGAPPRAG